MDIDVFQFLHNVALCQKLFESRKIHSKFRDFCACVYNVSTGHVLQLIAKAIGCAGRASALPKMWEFEVQMRDSGMSCVLRDIQAKAEWLVTICSFNARSFYSVRAYAWSSNRHK